MAADILPDGPVVPPFEEPERFQNGIIPRRVQNSGPWWKMGKWWKPERLFRKFIFRRLTPAERANQNAAKEERQRAKAQAAQLRTRAKILSDLIPLKLADLGVCYRRPETQKRRERVKTIRFSEIKMSPSAIFLKVDFRPGKTPIGIGVGQLSDADVMEALSVACANKVTCSYSSHSGFWYVVELTEGTRGVPSDVTWEECINRRPPRADLMSFPVGRGSGDPEWMSLGGDQPSIIIAGTTGAGKSVFLNSLICSLLAFNKPNTMRFAMVDLKGGIELSTYADIPHLLKIPEPRPFKKKKRVQAVDDDGTLEEHDEIIVSDDAQETDEGRPLVPAMITKRELVPDLFIRINRIMEHRIKLIRERQPRGRPLRNITEYNLTMPPGAKRLPHIVLCIDEFANIRLDKEIGAECERVLTAIASQGRAAGVHVILCTQVPNKAVISTNIKEVLPARISFSMPDIAGSMLIVGDGSAVNLSPPGRCIVAYGSHKELIQAPYISNDKVYEIVELAKAGRTINQETVRHEITPGEIWEWALKYNQGRLTVAELFHGLQRRGATHAKIEQIVAQHEGQTVMVGQVEYVVMARTFGGGRILMAKQNLHPDDHPAADVEETPAPEAPQEQPPVVPPDPPIATQPPPVSSLDHEIVEWAVRSQAGYIRNDETLAAFAGRETVRQLKARIIGLDGRTFDVRGQLYRVEPPIPRKTARRTVAVQPAAPGEQNPRFPAENSAEQSIVTPPVQPAPHRETEPVPTEPAEPALL